MFRVRCDLDKSDSKELELSPLLSGSFGDHSGSGRSQIGATPGLEFRLLATSFQPFNKNLRLKLDKFCLLACSWSQTCFF